MKRFLAAAALLWVLSYGATDILSNQANDFRQFLKLSADVAENNPGKTLVYEIGQTSDSGKQIIIIRNGEVKFGIDTFGNHDNAYNWRIEPTGGATVQNYIGMDLHEHTLSPLLQMLPRDVSLDVQDGGMVYFFSNTDYKITEALAGRSQYNWEGNELRLMLEDQNGSVFWGIEVDYEETVKVSIRISETSGNIFLIDGWGDSSQEIQAHINGINGFSQITRDEFLSPSFNGSQYATQLDEIMRVASLNMEVIWTEIFETKPGERLFE